MKTTTTRARARSIAALIGLSAAFSASTTAAETIRVSDDAGLYRASRGANPGDVVEIEGGRTYKGRIFWRRPGTKEAPITVRGIPKDGKRPIIKGGDAVFYVSADHYVFESLELTGGTGRCVMVEAHDITLRDSIIHDCQAHGLLAADSQTGDILVDRCEFYGSGGGDRHHQIYVTSDQNKHPGSVFRLQHSYLHDGKGGHNVKSRAERNEIYFNWIEGAYYHELELIGPDVRNPAARREDSDIVGNVLIKKNPKSHGIRLGGDGTMDTDGRYRLVNNTFVMLNDHRSAVRLFDGIESLELYNNVFANAAGGAVTLLRTDRVKWTRGKPLIVGSHNFIPDGSHEVPGELSATIGGTDPGLVALGSGDVRPSAGSPLVDAGASEWPTHPDAAFPRGLTDLTHQPRRALGVPVGRASRGAIDVGALEQGEPVAQKTPPPPVKPPKPGTPVEPTTPVAPPPTTPGASRCNCSSPGAPEGWAGGWGLLVAAALVARRRRR